MKKTIFFLSMLTLLLMVSCKKDASSDSSQNVYQVVYQADANRPNMTDTISYAGYMLDKPNSKVYFTTDKGIDSAQFGEHWISEMFFFKTASDLKLTVKDVHFVGTESYNVDLQILVNGVPLSNQEFPTDSARYYYFSSKGLTFQPPVGANYTLFEDQILDSAAIHYTIQ
jgi:hypothetical protein